jgi:hypothetical protein
MDVKNNVAHNTKYTPSFAHHIWTFNDGEVVLLEKKFNTQIIQISTYLKVGCEILTFYPLVVDFSQPFNSYNVQP